MRMSVVKLIGVFAISFFAIRRVFWVMAVAAKSGM